MYTMLMIDLISKQHLLTIHSVPRLIKENLIFLINVIVHIIKKCHKTLKSWHGDETLPNKDMAV